MPSFEDELRRAVRGLSLGEIPEDVVARMAVLDRLLVQWSTRVDLVGFKTAEERVRSYFAEPLAAARWLPERMHEALDIGSGGGTPALPLALWAPGCRWTLLEPRRKKALFLQEAVRALAIPEVRVLSERFDGRREPREPIEKGSYDLITTRGVRLGSSALERIVGCLRVGGRLLWFSGESRLRESAPALARPDVDVKGPMRLLGQGSRSSLLVVERFAEAGVFHVKQ